ncbi:MAG: hypothetical protein LBE48_06245 [Methanomassiliicoccaceae archaeon]|jgi:hypothetical protein|nr:hypothetical protein [Methanomassiliicoccaceae archaeon]
MMMIARNTDYDDILNAVKGRKVTVWSCNTCAKLCNGVGGNQAADKLADKLRADGVDVVSSVSVSAACLMSKVTPKASDIADLTDVVISLTCDIGVVCAARAFKKDVLAPLTTIGFGYVDDDGSLIVKHSEDVQVPATLNDVAKEKGMSSTPLV